MAITNIENIIVYDLEPILDILCKLEVINIDLYKSLQQNNIWFGQVEVS